ncbi:hypothetical protein E2C01_009589 [Portunus trituberculatus]|uniref:Uncharacterized protein n=1 Tax=Portunus trituberculatus TaxID=210409 RepID=A0A5B7D674_PORTR|nr:hypothetical protein [Portunus trituberculatus]
MACGSQAARGRGMGLSISMGEDERRYKIQTEEGMQARAAITHSVLTCTAYICLLIPYALGVGLSLRPSNISCSTVHASTPTALHYTPGSPPWASEHLSCLPSW